MMALRHGWPDLYEWRVDPVHSWPVIRQPGQSHRVLSSNDRLVLTIELLVVIAIAVGPYLAGAIHAVVQRGSHQFASRELTSSMGFGGIVAALQILIPTAYLAWRSGDSWGVFGVVAIRPRVDAALSVAVAAAHFVLMVLAGWSIAIAAMFVPLLDDLIDGTGQAHASAGASSSPMSIVTFALWMLINGASEEFVMKGYLLPKLKQWGGSTAFALVVSALLFGSYHLYQGPVAAIIVAMVSVPLGWLYLKIGRIWPFMFGHALYDVVAVAMHGGLPIE